MQLPKSSPDIRASMKRRAPTKTPQRVVDASSDPRVEAIVAAVRRLGAAGQRRRDWMYGTTVIPRGYVRLLDDSFFGLCDPDDIRAFGDAMRDAAYATARDNRGNRPLAEVLVAEADADADGQRAVANLTGAHKCPTRLRAVADSFAREGAQAFQARDAVMAEVAELERQQAAAR